MWFDTLVDSSYVYTSTTTGNFLTFGYINPLRIDAYWGRATVDQRIVVSDITVKWPFLTVDKWIFIALIFDDTIDADCKFYMGDLETLPSEPSAYFFQQAGEGAFNSDVGNFKLGNNSANNSGFNGDIAWFGLWGRTLSLGEIYTLWHRPTMLPDCKLYTWLGLHGAASATDWAFNNSPLFTNIALADPIPLGPQFGFDAHLPRMAVPTTGTWVVDLNA
jgi:hypothetical protein